MMSSGFPKKDKTLKQTSFSIQHRAGSLHEVANDSRPNLNTDFSVDWEHDKTLGGHAHADTESENNHVRERFHFYTSKGPVIIRCGDGYLAYGDGSRLEVLPDQYDEFFMLPAPHGGSYLRAGRNRFVEVDGERVSCDGFQPTELRVGASGGRRIQFQSPKGLYFRNDGGVIVADGHSSADGAFFEVVGDRHIDD